MSTLTIRKLPEVTKQRLRLQAAANGKSMEAEARDTLSMVLDTEHHLDNSWVGQLYDHALQEGGVNLEVPPDILDSTDLGLKIINPWDSWELFSPVWVTLIYVRFPIRSRIYEVPSGVQPTLQSVLETGLENPGFHPAFQVSCPVKIINFH